MEVLSVSGLCKAYPGFALRDVSFSLAPGTITGFIGRNGAGKTTTLKALLHFVHPDAGEIRFFGLDFDARETEIKGRLGFASGGAAWYPKKRLRAITAAARRCYPHWDEGAYRGYLERFALDEGKTPAQLSDGMKVKYVLALALSHRAELLLLDEPTSGLDPVSRAELQDIFRALAAEQGTAILFSTHITSDLEHCADEIIYLKQGKLVGCGPMGEFLAAQGGGSLEDVMLRVERGCVS